FASADPSVDSLFKVLRTHNLNNEPVASQTDGGVWKGEPFEQAMAFHYIAAHYGALSDWGNMRAAATSSLFQLRDFGDKYKGDKWQEQIVKAAPTNDTQGEQFLNKGYVVRDTDFALGYLMAGVANQQLATATGDTSTRDEANDYLGRAVKLNASLEPVAS